VGRRPLPLTGGEVERLPGACARCLFWELGGPCPQPRSPTVLGGLAPAVPPHEAQREPTERKRDWVEACTADGLPAGAVVEVPRGTQRDREVAGFALFAPSERYAPRGGTAPRADRDALLLATVYVGDIHREAGIGRLLLQAALREAIRQDRPAVEAYGDRRFRERTCLLPVTWLLHEGFTIHREHPRTPLLRLDTRRTVRWAESLEHAWDEVLARLPVTAPVPRRGGTVSGAVVSTSRQPGGNAD
jgi:GNAT superfamily N-acetyltransferase